MKKIMLLFIIPILLFGLISCQGSDKEKINKIEGIIEDVAVNNITIKAKNDKTYEFSTVDVDKTGVDGIVVGDSFIVFFKGDLKPDQVKQEVKVTELKKIVSGNEAVAD